MAQFRHCHVLLIVAVLATAGYCARYEHLTETASPTQPAHLYVWAGARNATGPDFLATFGLDLGLPTYGRLLCVTYVDTKGNEPHHMGFADENTLVAGGLQSFASSQDELFFFDLSKNASCPEYSASFNVPGASTPDEFLQLPVGGFLVSMLGDEGGGTPGAIAKFSGPSPDSFQGLYPERSPTAQPPAMVASACGHVFNQTAHDAKPTAPEDDMATFNPHGHSFDAAQHLFMSVDYLEPRSTLKKGSTGGVVLPRTTVRAWTYPALVMLRTINVTASTCRAGATYFSGFMDCRIIPRRSNGLAFANGGGILYLIDLLKGTSQVAWTFNPHDGPCIQSISSNGTRLYIAMMGSSQVFSFDVQDPYHLRQLDMLQLPDGAGPHVMKLLPSEDRIVVADYFWQQNPDVGVVFSPNDMKIRMLHVSDGRLRLDEGFEIDFNSGKDGLPIGNPHGLAVPGVSGLLAAAH